MVSAQEVESGIKSKRLVQDLEIDFYIKTRRKLNDMVAQVASGNRSKITTEELKSIETSLYTSKIKILNGIKADLTKYICLLNDFENFDKNLSVQQSALTEKMTRENVIIEAKLNKLTEVLEERSKINKLIQKYLKTEPEIHLTRIEIKRLFGSLIDPQMVIKGGRIIKRGETEDQDLLMFVNSAKFVNSCEELQKQIDAKVSECEKLKENIKSNKSKWESLSVELQGFIDNIIKFNQ